MWYCVGFRCLSHLKAVGLEVPDAQGDDLEVGCAKLGDDARGPRKLVVGRPLCDKLHRAQEGSGMSDGVARDGAVTGATRMNSDASYGGSYDGSNTISGVEDCCETWDRCSRPRKFCRAPSA